MPEREGNFKGNDSSGGNCLCGPQRKEGLLGSTCTGKQWRGMKLGKTPTRLVRFQRRDQSLVSQILGK